MLSIEPCPKRVACKGTRTQAALQLMMSLAHIIPEAQRFKPIEIKRNIDQYPDRSRVSREPASTAEVVSGTVYSKLLTSQLSSILAPWGAKRLQHVFPDDYCTCTRCLQISRLAYRYALSCLGHHRPALS
jgi:hypothetical protein